MLCAMGTTASYNVCCVLLHVLCRGHYHFVPRALLLYVLYAVYCGIFCAALLLQYCMMFTGTCFVPWALLLHILYAVYCYMFAPWTLLVLIIYSCMFCTVGHSCFIYYMLCTASFLCVGTPASYIVDMLCTAA